MNPLRKFKTYVNLTSVPAKLDMLLDSASLSEWGITLTRKSKTEQGRITAGFFDAYADDLTPSIGSGKNCYTDLLTGSA
jgi:hypothetical protein